MPLASNAMAESFVPSTTREQSAGVYDRLHAVIIRSARNLKVGGVLCVLRFVHVASFMADAANAVPHLYPVGPVIFRFKESNFPFQKK